MIKVVDPSGFDFFNKGLDHPLASIIPISKSGTDKSFFKQAGCFEKELSELQQDPNHTYIHLIALGAGETYGANRNGDYFSKDACEKCHNTFVKYGKYFRDHKNKDTDPSYGYIKSSAYNPDMHRVELIVGLQNDKCRDELHKLASNEDIPVSMSCWVDYDVCSICQNKAKSRKEYCKHASEDLTELYNDGRQVYVDNPNPKWFDISKVNRPADRIAYVMYKAAGSDIVVPSAELAANLNIEAPVRIGLSQNIKVANKLDYFDKLSKMEKQIEGQASKLAPSFNVESYKYLTVDEAKKLNKNNTDGVIKKLADSKIILPIESFGVLFNLSIPKEAKSYTGNMYNTLIPNKSNICENSQFNVNTSKSASFQDSYIIDKLIPAASLSSDYVTTRIQKAIIKKANVVSLSNINTNDIPDDLKDILCKYASYQVSMLDYMCNLNDNNELPMLILLQNRLTA